MHKFYNNFICITKFHSKSTFQCYYRHYFSSYEGVVQIFLYLLQRNLNQCLIIILWLQLSYRHPSNIDVLKIYLAWDQTKRKSRNRNSVSEYTSIHISNNFRISDSWYSFLTRSIVNNCSSFLKRFALLDKKKVCPMKHAVTGKRYLQEIRHLTRKGMF